MRFKDHLGAGHVKHMEIKFLQHSLISFTYNQLSFPALYFSQWQKIKPVLSLFITIIRSRLSEEAGKEGNIPSIKQIFLIYWDKGLVVLPFVAVAAACGRQQCQKITCKSVLQCFKIMSQNLQFALNYQTALKENREDTLCIILLTVTGWNQFCFWDILQHI